MSHARALNASTTDEDRIFGLLGLALRVSSRVSPRLAGRFLYWLWCHPIRHRPPPREASFKKKLRAVPFTVRGTSYRYYEMGRGPTVLAVHGWDGRGLQLMAFFEPLVAAGYKVVTFDAQAHGESPGRQTNAVVIREMILEVARLAGRPHALLAHSMGGSFALAALDELTLRKVVLIAPPRSLESAYEKVKQRLGIPDAPERHFKAALERDFPNVWNRFSIDRIVPSLGHVPGLIIQDSDDDFVLPEEGRAIHERWQGSQLHMTAGLGHRKILRSKTVVDRVLQFLGPAPGG